MVKGVAEVHRNDPGRPERSHPHPHHPPLPQIVHKNLHPPLLQNLHKNLHPLLPKYLPNRLRRRLLLLLLPLRYLLIANRVAKTMRRSIMNKIAALLRNHRILQKALHPLPLPSLLNQQRPEPHLSCRIQLMCSRDPPHKRQTMKCLSTHSQRLRRGSCRLLWRKCPRPLPPGTLKRMQMSSFHHLPQSFYLRKNKTLPLATEETGVPVEVKHHQW